MKELIARLRLMSRQHNTLAIGDEAADALEAQQAEIEALRTRLEIDPRHHIDGIQARDTTIKLLEAEIEALREAMSRLVGSEQGARLVHKCKIIAADRAREK